MGKIDKERYDKVRHLYFLWKELNSEIKKDYTRGINLPEAITEPICCYVNGFSLSTGSGSGSEDALTDNYETVQVKASSNFNSDLTSFGPKSEFRYLHFVRLNQSENKMYLYDIPTKDLNEIYVNEYETFKDQQEQGRRPRFSIINKYIIPQDIKAYAIVDLETGDIEK